MAVKRLKQLAKDWDVRPGAGPSIVERFERELPAELQLPPEYLEFMRFSDGASVGWDTLDTVFSLEEALDQSRDYGFLAAGILIFGTTGGGDAYCFARVSGKTVVTHHPLDDVPAPTEVDLVASSFEAFVSAAWEQQKQLARAAVRQEKLPPAKKRTARGVAREVAWPTVVGDSVPLRSNHKDTILSLAVAPDGGVLATASSDGTIRLLDLSEQKLLHKVGTPKARPFSIQFSSDGSRLLAGLAGWSGPAASRAALNVVRTWDVKSGEVVGELRGHDAGVVAIALSPDGAMLLSGGTDCTARIWNLADSSLLHVVRVQGRVLSVAWCEDGREFAVSSFAPHDSALDVFATADAQQLASMRAPWDCTCIQYAGSDRLLAGGRMLLRSTGATAWDLGPPPVRVAIADSASSLLITSHGGTENGGIILRDLRTGVQVSAFLNPPISATALAVLHDQRFVISGDHHGEVRAWRIRD
jgi:hypothetical protein